ncbi:hypothetical protein [Pseudomonas chlororaphis]|uniref:hypothetical protein n=1 Tax=Pseudomonas chlororaphis TaxID=587753 RepID=UPI0015DDDABA|nr:hypothetical protein [Pseudomonas chlororaphis]QLL14808.1 hypothetical protein H0I86_06835 [Pseudomonas chlororaphis subsp. aurantiaca]
MELRAQVGEADDALNLVASLGQVFHIRDRIIALCAEHSVLIYKIAIGSAETCEISFMLVDTQCQVLGISSGGSRRR